MTNRRWHYLGDINVCNGGYWIKRGDYPDYANCVEVIPCSEFGGPDNQWQVYEGSIYIGTDAMRIASALDCVGIDTAKKATWLQIAAAMFTYYGMEMDYPGSYLVQIGKLASDPSDPWRYGDNVQEADYILRGNASLKRFIRAEFLD